MRSFKTKELVQEGFTMRMDTEKGKDQRCEENAKSEMSEKRGIDKDTGTRKCIIASVLFTHRKSKVAKVYLSSLSNLRTMVVAGLLSLVSIFILTWSGRGVTRRRQVLYQGEGHLA
ncbi:hypothetical protein ElyMa_005774000 [Elysia marginata]|uniref:Transmembrane protein n=1 Tax=Elysia marginata TaxID=1093978 RepID=A0AAV4FPF7_9GAST|nr:hypothetical protein ElyMa_005774000 [Elysia marginata]